ncbi:MAG: DUF2771 family protein [Pseudonocardiaceae bacterium]
MSRSVLVAALLATAALAGCSQPPAPEVTFSVDGRSAQTGPLRYCDVELTECEAADSAVAVLTVPTGHPVQISVPESVAETPWQVVFRYRKDGAQAGGRSEVFSPGARQEYTLQVPEAGALETLEVQQFGAPEVANGESNFRIRAVWVLAVEGPPGDDPR